MKKVKTFEIWSSHRPMEIDSAKELDNFEADDYIHMDEEMLMDIIDSLNQELDDCLNTADLKEVTEKIKSIKNKYPQIGKQFSTIWQSKLLSKWHKKLNEIKEKDPKRFQIWNDEMEAQWNQKIPTYGHDRKYATSELDED